MRVSSSPRRGSQAAISRYLRILHSRVVLPAGDDSDPRYENIQIALVQSDHLSILRPNLTPDRYSKATARHERWCLRVLEACINYPAAIVVYPEYSGTLRLWARIRNRIAGLPIVVVTGSLKLSNPHELSHMGNWISQQAPTSSLVGRNMGLVLIGKTQEAAFYVKQSLSGVERRKVLPGNTGLILDVRYGHYEKQLRIGVGICHDFMDDAFLQAVKDSGVQLFILPSFTPTVERWQSRISTFCDDTQGVVCLTNLARAGGRYGHTGVWAFRPKGDGERQPDYLVSEINGPGCFAFGMYPDSVLRQVESVKPYVKIVESQSVGNLSI